MSIPLSAKEEFLQGLQQISARMSKAQRLVAYFLREHYTQVPFMTTSELATAAGTSQSSVTRFVNALGFESFAEFTKALRPLVLGEASEPPPVERFARKSNGDTHQLLELEAAHLLSLDDTVASAAFERLVRRLSEAPRVLVAGFGAAAPMAQHLGLNLARLRPDVRTVQSLDVLNLVQWVHYRPQDYLLMFGVPRYPAETLILIEWCRARGLEVGLAADRVPREWLTKVDDFLLVPATFTLTSAVSASALVLGSLLLDAVGRLEPERTLANLGRFEDLTLSFGYFAQDSLAPNPPLAFRARRRKPKR